jgi:hypothetical protein
MKLLINDKELANFLLWCMPIPRELKAYRIEDRFLATYIDDWVSKKSKWSDPNRELKPEEKAKFAEKLIKAVARDVHEWADKIKHNKLNVYNMYFDAIHKNIEYFIDKIGEEELLRLYKKSKYSNFAKGTGLAIDPKGELIRRKRFTDYKADCLIRNTVGNEGLLVTKINEGHPMWFIDSGYTNFLEPNKKWHRLVRNHLHYGEFFDAPADRLGNFLKFPKPWKQGGEIIYIIEPGPFAAQVFGVNLKTWKYDIAKELRKYTDKRIVFRKKAPKRQRPSLVKQLQKEDYYCVVSLNSNAATEAIWEGIPVITLGTHITNPVSRNKLSDINDLWRGNLAPWLSMLSYSQFTKEELIDGSAVEIVKKYNNV